MGYRNKTYLCFDGDNDIHYYYLMKAWKHNQRDFFKEFDFYDAHDINTARDTSTEDTIKRRLLERLNNSKLFVVLIGDQTRFLYRFVKWEIEQAIKQDIPIIGVNLNGKREIDEEKCPPVLRNETVLHVSFNQKIIEKAMAEWSNLRPQMILEKKTGPCYFLPSVYTGLGL
jgi:hypothetical protein